MNLSIFSGSTMGRPLLILSLAAGILFSCSKKQENETELVTFPLRGEVVGLDTARNTVTVTHEAIPNYMNAMTMPFKVKDRSLLRSVGIGDTIRATLAVSRTESWLETIAVAGRGGPERAVTAGEILTARIFKTGEPFPDETLLDQEGRRISFRGARGKALALTFIYTRCPLPDFCIRMSTSFARLQKTLETDARLNGAWQLFSISFDPTFDRPPVLRRYATTYGADLRTWTFATDPDTAGAAIRRLADGLGLTYANDEGLIAHNLRTVLIDKQGRLVRVISGNEWTVEEVAAELRALALQ